MINEEEIECECTDEVVCPWCGYEYQDSWEFHRLDASTVETNCLGCQKPFEIYIEFNVNYYTNKL